MARAPSPGRGEPLAMWIMPSTLTSSAVQPIAARTVSELRSGCRRNRQASSTASTGRIQDSEPNPSTAAVWMARPTALPIRAHSEAASTMATPRVSSPTPSRRWCGSRSRAPRPTARAPQPTAPATPSQAAAIILPVQATRITTGSRGFRAGGRPFAVPFRPVPCLPAGFWLPFFLGAERAWLPCPCLRRRAGDCDFVVAFERAGVSGAASYSPPRGRADPLRARVAIVTNVARTRSHPKHLRGVSRLRRKHVVVAVRVAETASQVERAGRGVGRLDLEQDPAPPLAGRRGGQACGDRRSQALTLAGRVYLHRGHNPQVPRHRDPAAGHRAAVPGNSAERLPRRRHHQRPRDQRQVLAAVAVQAEGRRG